MMTERPHSSTPHSATPIEGPLPLSASNDHGVESLEEEPYTIKCICDYTDDDGNTIYCETCDTWQHIECFYPGNVDDALREEFDHFCADCKPRSLDRRHATERQRQNRHRKAINDSAEKKSKRIPSKSHKKKPKPSDVQVNGWHDDNNGGSHRKHGSPHDPPPSSKRPKGSHRPSHSTSSHTGKGSPSVPAAANSNNLSHGHPPSPSYTPPDHATDLTFHSYSPEFLKLYTSDPGPQDLRTNSFASLSVTNFMSAWLHDPEKLLADTGIAPDAKNDYLRPVPPGSSASELITHPDALEMQTRDQFTNDGHLRWRFLITKEALAKDKPIGELQGEVGLQSEYSADPSNSPVHPEPFVFFHPDLPIYIDTRREGSLCRYVRRSCRPNASIDTHITNEAEYHFFIVPDTDLAAGDEVTITWTFPKKGPVLLGLSGDLSDSSITDVDINEFAAWIDVVLSKFGGCACGLGRGCSFAKFHRRYFGDLQQQLMAKPKKGRKPKQPQVNGTTNNVRAVSEGRVDAVDGDDETRSTSGSIKSKPQSRDMTPLTSGVDENDAAGGPSEREKRKIAALEETFRKMDNDVQQPPRKKKRASNGPTPNPVTVAIVPQIMQKPKSRSRASVSLPATTNGNGNGHRKRTYVDASTSRQTSASPASGLSPTAMPPAASRVSSRQVSRQPSMTPPRTNYQDSSVQTDPEMDAWYTKILTPTTKKAFVPLTQRLLNHRHHQRKEREARRYSEQFASPQMNCRTQGPLSSPLAQMSVSPMDTTHIGGRKHSIASLAGSVGSSSASDVQMSDAPPIAVSDTTMPPPPSWLGGTSQQSDHASVLGYRPSDLRVHLPTAHAFVNNTGGSPSPSPNAPAQPSSAFGLSVSPVMQHIPTPSPIKKKLSLSDYAKRKRPLEPPATNPSSLGSSPILAPAVLEPVEAITDEIKSNNLPDESAMVDTPTVEIKTDPTTLTVPTGPIPADPTPASVTTPLSAKPSSVPPPE
jgi:hypothetical protein